MNYLQMKILNGKLKALVIYSLKSTQKLKIGKLKGHITKQN